MNSTLNYLLWFMAVKEKIDDNIMVNLIIKWMGVTLVLSGAFAGLDSNNALYNLGCAASILFGFMLQTAHLRRRKKLTKGLVFWNAVTTGSVCWLAIVFWNAKWSILYKEWIMVYLFVCSFMAVVISELLYSMSRFGFKELFRILARKFLSETDKEGEKL